ncbi:MAG: hypothetical protein K2L23_00420, partial [Odoribacter sp.]|nr:hypothetical protein [Odoribacter sp.]
MKKNNRQQAFTLQNIKFFLPLLLSVFSGVNSLQAQQHGQIRQKITADRIISGEELRRTNPINLWEAIKLLEPSLLEKDEELHGSDPNHIPGSTDLRGCHRWPSESAQPIFVLDNALVDARRIQDLNINEVAETIIRKDAATLAAYGLRGSNGVIEIRTIRPEIGSIRLSYSFDGSFQWADLTSWNVLNASEKLELERASGLYDSKDPDTRQQLQQLLSERKNGVAGGINTNWLKVPLQTAFSHRHKIDVYGGDEFVRYTFSLRAAPGTEGVMKKSKRDIYGADAYL